MIDSYLLYDVFPTNLNIVMILWRLRFNSRINQKQSNALDSFQESSEIFELLSILVIFASSVFDTLAHLIPFTLLHAIDIPIPDPHIAIP